MESKNRSEMNATRTTITDLLHLFTLGAFAVAQPIFDLFGRQAEFFVARRSEPVDIVILTTVLCLAVPGVLAVLEIIVGLVNLRARRVCHVFLVSILVSLILLPALKRTDFLSIGPLLMTVAVAGVVFAYTYVRFGGVRLFVSALTPAILIFPALFLFHSPVNRLLFPEKPVAHSVELRSTPPIVMLVFDEMSSISLMDEHQHIDPIRFPNFAALAEDATWFRNATAVVQVTEIALPALLTGRYPSERRLPVASEFPNNLFTLLSGSYRLEVVEPITELCPHSPLDDRFDREPLKARMTSLSHDVGTVYLHVILPFELTRMLPPINRNWSDFSFENTKRELEQDRRQHFFDFVNRIEHRQKPTFFFDHLLLPHCPYDYLPSGRKYSPTAGLDGLSSGTETWCKETWPVIQAHQRYLLQVEFVDRLLGRLIRHLKERGLYDRAAIVVTSDHGVSFIPGEKRRGFSTANLADMMSVLLMIKAPGQHRGVIDDSNVETVDVLPALADLLDVQIPWTVDGRSPFDPSARERTEKTLYLQNLQKLTLNRKQVARSESLQRQLARFGSGRERGFFPCPPSPHHLIGRKPHEFPEGPNAAMHVQFDRKAFYEDFNPGGDFVPSHITGRLTAKASIDRPIQVALAVNDVIRAEVPSGNNHSLYADFSAIIPDFCFRPGRNRIEAYLVHSAGEKVELARIESNADLFFSYKREGKSEYLVKTDGKRVPIVPDGTKGWVEAVSAESGFIRMGGWAADFALTEPAQTVALVAGDRCIYANATNQERPDVASYFKHPALIGSGFVFRLPRRFFEKTPIRVLAVSRSGVASELGYQPRAEWLQRAGELSYDARTVFSGFVTPSEAEVSCTLQSIRGQEQIACSDGTSIPLKPGALEGWLEIARPVDGAVHLQGWAAEVAEARPAAAVAIFARGNFLLGTRALHDRPDVAKHFSDARLTRSGYSIDALIGDIQGRDLRVLALSATGVAHEVAYHSSTEWIHSASRPASDSRSADRD